MKKTLLLASILAASLLVFSGCTQSEKGDSRTTDNPSVSASQQHDPKGQDGESSRGGKSSSGGEDKSKDEDLQAMIAEVAPSFTQESYNDSETGLTVPYELYLPQDCNEDRAYPLVVFIGDMTTVGTDTQRSLTQGWGGIVWATAAEQAKHECIVAVLTHPETIIDVRNGQTVTDYVTLTPRLIGSIAERRQRA